MGKHTVRQTSTDPKIVPLRDVMVTYRPSGGSGKGWNFSGPELARLISFAIGHRGINAAVDADQSGRLDSLADLLATLATAEDVGNPLWIVETAARDIVARMDCPKTDEEAARLAEDFIITINAPKAVA